MDVEAAKFLDHKKSFECKFLRFFKLHLLFDANTFRFQNIARFAAGNYVLKFSTLILFHNTPKFTKKSKLRLRQVSLRVQNGSIQRLYKHVYSGTTSV